MRTLRYTVILSLLLTGAAYRGVGVAGCIAQARTAAARVIELARLETRLEAETAS